MKITDLLDESSIILNLEASSKEDALNKVINLMNETGNLNNKEEYAELVFNREKEGDNRCWRWNCNTTWKRKKCKNSKACCCSCTKWSKL